MVYMTFMLVPRRQRKENGEFEARLGHRVTPCFRSRNGG